MPLRFSSTAAYWPVRPMRRRTWSGWRATSNPATRARPASARSKVARIRTAVVFRPVGAEQAEHRTGVHLQVEAIQGPRGAEAPASAPSASMAMVKGASFRLFRCSERVSPFVRWL